MAGMTKEQMEAALLALQAENAALKAKQAAGRAVSFKVSDKGAVSIYGLSSRFPVTMYLSQFVRFANEFNGLVKFYSDNRAKLSVKDGQDRAALNAALDNLLTKYWTWINQ